MHLELRPMTKEDAQEATSLVIESYKNNTFRAIKFPTGMGQINIARMVDNRQKAVDDPDKYGLKVVDTDNNDKMAGCAVWEYTKAMTDEDWERSKREMPGPDPALNLDIAREFIVKEDVAKQRIMGHTRWLELNSLNTLPEYQRRGIGSMLTKWGIEKLEEMHVPAFVTSTVQGYGLYLKHGFKEIERWETDLSRWPPGQGTYMNAFMTRMPSGHTASSS